MPSTVEAYTHRIGRTGRAEQTGEALTFVTNEDMRLVRAIERVLGYKLTVQRVAGIESAANLQNEGRQKAPGSNERSWRPRRRRFRGRNFRR